MNSLEWYLAVLRGGVPDFVPRMPILMRFAAEHVGSHPRICFRLSHGCAGQRRVGP